jgi:hypothetical protein
MIQRAMELMRRELQRAVEREAQATEVARAERERSAAERSAAERSAAAAAEQERVRFGVQSSSGDLEWLKPRFWRLFDSHFSLFLGSFCLIFRRFGLIFG